MPNYSSIQKEETFKAAIFRVFFSSAKYAYEPNIGNIDYIVTEAKTLKGNIWKRHYLWAESKKGAADIPSMLTQLVLTIKKIYEKGEHLPPPYIACFDTAKIAFVPFHDILPIKYKKTSRRGAEDAKLLLVGYYCFSFKILIILNIIYLV